MSAQATLAQGLNPFEPNALNLSWVDPLIGHRVKVSVPLPEPRAQAHFCADNDLWGLAAVNTVSANMPGRHLSEEVYTISVNLPRCRGSGTFAHTRHGWYLMFPGPRGGGDDSGEDSGGGNR